MLLLVLPLGACARAPREQGERLAMRLDGALEVLRARVLAAGGAPLLRRLALPRPGEPAEPRWETLAAGFLPGTRAATPVFLRLREEEGTDLFRPNQAAFVEECYVLRVVDEVAVERTMVAELCVSPLPADVSRLPER